MLLPVPEYCIVIPKAKPFLSAWTLTANPVIDSGTVKYSIYLFYLLPVSYTHRLDTEYNPGITNDHSHCVIICIDDNAHE